jgi:hypothetical protein
MACEPPVVVLDACVLYPFHLRNLLIQCAFDRLIDARWAAEIHDEWIRSLLADNPGVAREALERTRDLMNRVLPNALVVGYESHIPKVALRDADDRHVVAAGIAAQASLIVTWNIRDFPPRELAKHSLKPMTPDELLANLFEGAPELLIAATARARLNLTKSAAAEFLDTLRRQKLHRFAKAMMTHATRL